MKTKLVDYTTLTNVKQYVNDVHVSYDEIRGGGAYLKEAQQYIEEKDKPRILDYYTAVSTGNRDSKNPNDYVRGLFLGSKKGTYQTYSVAFYLPGEYENAAEHTPCLQYLVSSSDSWGKVYKESTHTIPLVYHSPADSVPQVIWANGQFRGKTVQDIGNAAFGAKILPYTESTSTYPKTPVTDLTDLTGKVTGVLYIRSNDDSKFWAYTEDSNNARTYYTKWKAKYSWYDYMEKVNSSYQYNNVVRQAIYVKNVSNVTSIDDLYIIDPNRNMIKLKDISFN